MRQLELLEEFKFKINYIFRKENSRSDTLSQRLDYIEEKDVINTPIL